MLFRSLLRKKVRLICLTNILFLFFPFTSFCFAETGVEPRSVVLASHQPLSGPAQEYADIGKSAQAYFKYVNDQGGVHGRFIDLKIVDDQLKPKMAARKIAELTVKNNIFLINRIANLHPYLTFHLQ